MILICNIVRFICYHLFSILASLYIQADVNYLFIGLGMWYTGASQVALEVKNPPANGGNIRDMDSIPGLGRSPGGGHGDPFQYSCLENPMDRGAWQAMVHNGAKCQTRLKQLTMHACMWKITWVLRVRAPQNILKDMLPWPCHLPPLTPHAFYPIPTHTLLVNLSHSFLVSLSYIVGFAITLGLKKWVCPNMTALLENNLNSAWILCLFYAQSRAWEARGECRNWPSWPELWKNTKCTHLNHLWAPLVHPLS